MAGACAHLAQTFELCVFSDIRIFWKASKTFGARKLVRSHKKSLRLSSLPFWPLGRASAHFVAQKLEAKKAQPHYLEFCHTEAGSGCGKYILDFVRMYELSTFLVLTLGAQHPPSKFVREKHLLLPHILSNGFLVLAYVVFWYILQFFCAFFSMC